MIGNYLPPGWRQSRPRFHGELDIDPFRQELRRGCLALAALAALRDEQYGYTLRQSLKRRGLSVEQGTLYPLLKRLETQGFLVSEWRHEGGRQKRFYRLSAAGLRLLELLQREWREIGQTINAIVDEPQSRAA
ncbi:MAG TPA: helix-turn-helix transcriptional regulator [Gammaproteobacteria bacterium]|nr:helix-turn-helix transcriptional regulator [Gammaproteobacteria bacterium]